LAELADVLHEDRKVVVLRELTKLFESVISGSAEEVKEYFASHKKEVRGEFVVSIAP
jgi:16S rRNA (cytidine1402-2'-O)-methyltransferase